MTSIYKCSQMSASHISQSNAVDKTPLNFLDDLITAQKVKQEPQELVLPTSNIHLTNDEKFKNEGIKILKNKQAAVMILAGGSATRLGAEVPKGAFQIGLEGFSCTYEVLINQCKKLFEPEIIIMLSSATESSIKFLEERDYFGYNKDKIHFVFQPEYPVISETKQLLLDEHQNIQTSPNGNGGFLKAISKLNLPGVEYIHVVFVDNPFVKILDPEMLGFASLNNFEVVNRVLQPKVGEKVGICGLRNIEAQQQAPLCSEKITAANLLKKPCPAVFEYSEIDIQKIKPEEQYANIGNHLFRTSFLKPLIDLQESTGTYITPYHLAHKKIPYFDAEQQKMVTPAELNAYKVEHFIFDYFHFCSVQQFGLFVCSRDEFCPIKEPKDIDEVKRLWK
ncbi:UDP-N-acetylglucosamine_pyrophosphorylase [Hexamita inflata]|uniref:UDP-N-acetylglucosamine diphosphorylase n=1 Tax=Hexamita inflata TaxID=28002 RepID=A0AA86V0J5_9EUKA|nr:UDP-N-acetylglucosamine pyrophosphorylase [Hexamita inflata]